MTSIVLHLEGGDEMAFDAHKTQWDGGSFIALHGRTEDTDLAIFVGDKAALFRLSNAIARATGNMSDTLAEVNARRGYEMDR